MTWGSLLCDRMLNDEAVQLGVADAFGIGRVSVVSTVEDLPDELPFVILAEVGGDFSCSAEVYLAHEDAGLRVDALVRFARSVNCRVVTDTELNVGVDPFDWTLAEPGGQVRRVTLDLDDEADGVYRLR